MSQRVYSYLAGWEWHILQHTTPEDMIKGNAEAAEWIINLNYNDNHSILISQHDNEAISVQGSLSIQLSEDKDDVHKLHFWMSRHKLITIHQDNRIPIRLQHLKYTAIYEQCSSAPEAFCVMINALLEPLHINLDHYQTKLGELEQKVRRQNRKDLLDDIIECRYELLHYSHLYLPYREFEGIVHEAFLEYIEQSKHFIRLQYRFDRINTMLGLYSEEINTLLTVDDAISSLKGNEIIRTLTIFTVLCLPATILGSIWGSNFKWLPFKDHAFGFLFLIGIIFVITSFLSFLLWKKGWTGDIISNNKSKKSRANRKFALHDTAQAEHELEETDAYTELPSRKDRKVVKANVKKSAPVTLEVFEQDVLEQLPKRSKRKN